ncbi:hypothetical protein Ga0061069_10473 [Thiomonas bhubaneswarensis]|uniref:Uncharacterized protein n=2 Tax=Thiomonas bhubaneswarensis TaxID=339866 RepID=A0A0K6HZM4_9BURK|nr:hypothetical protein Ga0061069_10473 [Thiomonas bhubaneswarensis]
MKFGNCRRMCCRHKQSSTEIDHLDSAQIDASELPALAPTSVQTASNGRLYCAPTTQACRRSRGTYGGRARQGTDLSPKRIGLILGVVSLVVATHANAAPVAPTELHAMRLLYGPAYTRRGSVVEVPDPHGVRFNKPPGYHHTITEYVTPWKTASVTLDGTPYFIATGQGHAVENPQHPSEAAHVQAAYISAIWFAWKAGHWTMAGKDMNLTSDGSFGEAVGKPWTPFPRVALLQHAAVLVADEGGYMNQGNANSWFPIYEFTATGLRSLGNVPSGADNTGSGMKPVISFKGKFLSAAMDGQGFPTITLGFSGKTAIHNKPVDLHNVPCSFDYQNDPAKPQGQRFRPTTQECEDILASSF